MRRKKESLIMIIILLVLFLGIGYAFLTTSLSINGTTDVDSNTWNVYWDNVQVKDGSVTGDQVITQPTISQDKTTVAFRIRLKEPGEYYEFTIDARNDGSIDAMVDVVNNATNIPDYLKYTVTYSDDIEVEGKQLLEQNSLETYKIRVEYRTDINPSSLPSTSQSVSVSIDVPYIQADKTSRKIRNEVFNSGMTATFTIGSPIPNNGVVYDNYQDAIEESGNNIFFKHTIDNNIITATYLGFILNNKVYYLRGLGQTFDQANTCFYNDSIYYESNKKTLNNAFGDANCTVQTDPMSASFEEYRCNDSTSGLKVYAAADGLISGNDGASTDFIIFANGDSYIGARAYHPASCDRQLPIPGFGS